MTLENRLVDLLSTPAADDVKYQPRTELDGVSGVVQTGPLKEAPTNYDELLTSFGYDPAEVGIVGHPRVS